MIYLKELNVVDFQTHVNTTIEFSPNFNVIVGSTRSGKSSIVRALDFLLYNNWYEDYQRFDTKYAEVSVTLSTGKKIIRQKSLKINKITLIDPKETQRFEAFGTTLPAEITAALGVVPIDIGVKDPLFANIANQDDPLFLLYAAGTDRTRVLSRLSGLHWIDYALKDLSKDRRTKSTEVQFLQETNEQLLEKLRAFRNIKDFRNILTIEQDRLARTKKVSTLLQNSRVLIGRAAQWKKDYQMVQDLKTIDFPVEVARLERLIHLQSDVLQPAQDLIRKLVATNTSIATTQTYLRSLAASRETLEAQIADEMTKVPTCDTCGQEIREHVKGLHE
jgi:DNA repair ATPase RecN